jgi:hypothetical protein
MCIDQDLHLDTDSCTEAPHALAAMVSPDMTTVQAKLIDTFQCGSSSSARTPTNADEKSAPHMTEPPQPSTTQIANALQDMYSAIDVLRKSSPTTLSASTFSGEADLIGEAPPKKVTDDATLVGLVKHLENLLFPGELSEAKPAELCYTDLLQHLMRDGFR